MTSFLKRHSLVAFFVLAFGISWGNYLLSRAWPNFPFIFPYGPLLAAVIVASVTRGMDGLKDLLHRCLRWRVKLKWYLAALLVPAAIALTAVWHVPVALAAPSITAYLIGSVASAVLANWVYYNAHESALLVIVYHTAQNAIGGWYLFRMFSGPELVRLWWLWSAAYVVVVFILTLVAGPNLRRPPHPL